jgi:streptomycin 6-kinase
VPDADADAALREWRSRLPQITVGLARRWSLRLGTPFQSGPASWVAPARTAAGERVVLKAGWLHEEARHEADGLRIWAGDGTVRLIDSDTAGGTSALLLEACEPGTELAAALAEDERDVVIAGLLRRLWIEPPAGYPFRPLSQMCDDWAGRFVRDSGAAGARGQEQLDPGIARAGIELFRRLPATAERAVLLCTDLHHHNVLAATREPWLVIDPKPYLGDPCYDVLQHMLNFPHRLAADPAGLADRMAALLDLDRERVRLWLFARCVQESADDATLRAAAVALAP